MQEALRLRAHTLQPPHRPDSTQSITSFFVVLPSTRDTKRQIDNNITLHSISMQIWGATPLPRDSNDISRVDPSSVRR